jgi:hypothetical protein
VWSSTEEFPESLDRTSEFLGPSGTPGLVGDIEVISGCDIHPVCRLSEEQAVRWSPESRATTRLLPALLLAPEPRINPSVDPRSVEVEASLASAVEVPERALGPGAKAQDADEVVEVGRTNSGGDLHVPDEL